LSEEVCVGGAEAIGPFRMGFPVVMQQKLLRVDQRKFSHDKPQRRPFLS
jgi:hypothetical protein